MAKIGKLRERLRGLMNPYMKGNIDEVLVNDITVTTNWDVVEEFLNKFENLFLIGRNGMHRYNNMDHSMLTAITAVENIINDIKTKENIWMMNIENEYHEDKAIEG